MRTIEDVKAGDTVRSKVNRSGVPELRIGHHYHVDRVDGSNIFLDGSHLPWSRINFELVTNHHLVGDVLSYIVDSRRNISASVRVNAIGDLLTRGLVDDPVGALEGFLNDNPLGFCEDGIERARKHFGIKPPSITVTLELPRDEAEAVAHALNGYGPDSYRDASRGYGKIKDAINKTLGNV